MKSVLNTVIFKYQYNNLHYNKDYLFEKKNNY